MKKFLFTTFILFLSIFGLVNSAYSAWDFLWKNIGKQYKYQNLCISSDGKYFAAEKVTDSVHYIVYDLTTNQEVWSSPAYSGDWALINLSPDGKILALSFWSHNNNDTVRIIDWQANKELYNVVINQVTGLYFSPGGEKLFVTSGEFDYKAWKTKMFELDIAKKSTSKVPVDNIHDLQVSKDLSKLYVASITGTGATWDTIYSGIMNINTGEIIKKFFGYFYRTPKIMINRDETKMLTVEQQNDSILHFVNIDLNTGTESDNFTLIYKNTYSISVTDDWSYIIIQQMKDETDFVVLDLNTRKVVDSLHLYEKSGDFICNRSTNSIIFTSGSELWERNFLTKTQTRLAVLYNGIEHNGEVTCLDISPDKKYVASCAKDSKIKLWDAETGAFIKEFIDSLSALSAVKFTGDGNYLMSSSVSKKSNLKVWDINSGLVIREIKFPDYYLYKSVFNKQGDQLIFSANNMMVYFMDINSGTIKDSIMVYEQVSNLCLSESNNLFLCGQKIFKAYKYSANSYQEDHEFKYFYDLISVDINSSEDAIAYSSVNKEYITMINTNGWSETNTFSGWYTDYYGNLKNTNFHIIKFSHDNNYVFFSVGAVFKVINLSDTSKKYVYREMDLFDKSNITKIAVSDDDKILLTSHYDGSIVRWKTGVFSGVNNMETASGYVEIYPNPVVDNLTIKTGNQNINSIQITDMMGRCKNININNLNDNGLIFDCSGLETGLYFLKLTYLNKVEIFKFIKE